MGIIDGNLIADAHRAYFIGIGGVGMSALARVLKHQGLEVAGSDSKETRTTRELTVAGIPVFIGQSQIGFGDSDLIIYSSAIRPDHLELKAARESSRKVYHRAQILSSLFNQAKTSVAITGTHGKTTTSSMISFVLSELGKNPTCLVGGEVVNLGTNTILGGSELWVSEVDESDKTHEFYAPNYAVLTNLEEDHLDYYKNLNDLKLSFETFISNARNPGLIVYSIEDQVLRGLVRRSGRPQVSFGFSRDADFSAQNVELRNYGSSFDLYESGFFVTPVTLSIPGRHNIANALGSIALMGTLGLDPESILEPLSRFRGARRRLEIKWESPELTVVDDYAHHPTEVKASIRALKGMGRRLTVIFQPHRYSRTQHFYREFGDAFQEADEVILTEIYGAGESNPGQIDVAWILREVLKKGHPAAHVVQKNEILSYLMTRSLQHSVIAFLGAGDIGELADEFANRFKSLTTA